MYLVELRPGKEELYRTTEELAAAIRSGDVDLHSRIYHRATSKWISVTLHPQYKAIIAERTAAPSNLPPLERTNWTFFNDSAEDLAGAQDASGAGEGGDEGGRSNEPGHPWRRPLALSITGGLLILGVQLAASGPRPPWAPRVGAHAPTRSVTPAAAESPAGSRTGSMPTGSVPTVSLVSAGASWAEVGRGYVAPAGSDSARPAPVPAPGTLLPAAPRLRPKALLGALTPPAPAAPTSRTEAQSVPTFLERWNAAHDSALARLESGMRVARLGQLFAPERLSPAGGVTETRMSLAGVANFVRIYRQQQAAIEDSYQNAFTAASRAHGWSPAEVRPWYTRPARTEPAALTALTASLIDGIDSLLGVLDSQAGTYTLTRNAIRFEDAGAAREYMTLRERILETVDSARTSGAADHPGPMSYLLQAIGTTRLPIAI